MALTSLILLICLAAQVSGQADRQDNSTDTQSEDCEPGQWGEWSVCEDCQQIRYRLPVTPDSVAADCLPDKDITVCEECSAEEKDDTDSPQKPPGTKYKYDSISANDFIVHDYNGFVPFSNICEPTEWTDWSSCSEKCEVDGYSTRTRTLDSCIIQDDTKKCFNDCADEGDDDDDDNIDAPSDVGPDIDAELKYFQTDRASSQKVPKHDEPQESIGNVEMNSVLEKRYSWSPYANDPFYNGYRIDSIGDSDEDDDEEEDDEEDDPEDDDADDDDEDNKLVQKQCRYNKPYGAWTRCCKGADGKKKFKNQFKVKYASDSSEDCTPIVRKRRCRKLEDCGICVYGKWSEITECSKECGGGFLYRSRAAESGEEVENCRDLIQKLPCNRQKCGATALKCSQPDWTEWSGCTGTCGSGNRHRYKEKQRGSSRKCTRVEDSEDCENEECGCKWSEWSPRKPCVSICGEDVEVVPTIRSRNLMDDEVCDGDKVDFNYDAEVAPPCPYICETNPAQCIASEWSSFGPCSVSCLETSSSPHTQTRTRSEIIISDEECNIMKESIPCSPVPPLCRKPCEVGSWSGWESCNVECGEGSQSRTRSVLGDGAEECPEMRETRSCSTGVDCVYRDCLVSSWDTWLSSEGNTKTRYRHVITFPSPQGSPCPHLSETKDCNVETCSDHCEVSEWSMFSECETKCRYEDTPLDTLFVERSRTIIREAQAGGSPCPLVVDLKPCDPFPPMCEVIVDSKCEVGEWSEWTLMNQISHRVIQKRTRPIKQSPKGALCPPLGEFRDCNQVDCNLGHCLVSEWSEYDECSVQCDSGDIRPTRQRIRHVLVKAQADKECPHLIETRACPDLPACRQDCEVSEWSEVGDCSAACGDDTATRLKTRRVTQDSTHGGKPCPVLIKKEKCPKVAPCPVDCVMSNWTKFGKCSAECRDADDEEPERKRTREVVLKPQNGGQKCGPKKEVKPCKDLPDCSSKKNRPNKKTFKLPNKKKEKKNQKKKEKNGDKENVNCKETSWSEWGECNKECDIGRRTRSRLIQRKGKCIKQKQNGKCWNKKCKQGKLCYVGKWSDWAECSPQCGRRRRTSRTRVTLGKDANMCPPAKQSKSCKPTAPGCKDTSKSKSSKRVRPSKSKSKGKGKGKSKGNGKQRTDKNKDKRSIESPNNDSDKFKHIIDSFKASVEHELNKRSVEVSTNDLWPSSICDTTTTPPLSVIVEHFLNVVMTIDREFLEELIDEDGGLESAKKLFTANVVNGKACEEEAELLVLDEEAMIGAYEREEEDESEIEEDEEEHVDISSLPTSLDWRTSGMLHPPINQGACGSCGFVTGVQSLEARMAIVSENYQAYSVQNFMNCDGIICEAAQPDRMNHIVKMKGTPDRLIVVPESESPYIKHRCTKWEGGCKCAGRNYTNLLDEQFAFVGITLPAHSEAAILRAIQSGPVTTCFSRFEIKGKKEKCTPGCSHANSIVGYTPDSFIMQESYGFRWGPNKNGSWFVPRDSECIKNLIRKAYYGVIHYDYDKANAFYRDGLVDQYAVTLVNRQVYGVSSRDTSNMGLAKNKCALMGAECKGVMPGESIQLISDFKGGSRAKHPAFLKTQMVIYLQHASGEYLSIVKRVGVLTLKMKGKKDAAPFFTSFGRIVSYRYPTFHLVGHKLVEYNLAKYANYDVSRAWTLKDCNLFYPSHGLSLDLVKATVRLRNTLRYKTLGSSPFNPKSKAQRFDLGISGTWLLTSRLLNLPLRKDKDPARKTDKEFTAIFAGSYYTISKFRWNARQILYNAGKPVRPSAAQRGAYRFSEVDNQIVPTDCLLTQDGGETYIGRGWGKSNVAMSGEITKKNRWNFRYGDL